MVSCETQLGVAGNQAFLLVSFAACSDNIKHVYVDSSIFACIHYAAVLSCGVHSYSIVHYNKQCQVSRCQLHLVLLESSTATSYVNMTSLIHLFVT